MPPRRLPHRAAVGAALVSVALHAAVLLGVPPRFASLPAEPPPVRYTATLQTVAAPPAMASPPAPAAPRKTAVPPSRPRAPLPPLPALEAMPAAVALAPAPSMREWQPPEVAPEAALEVASEAFSAQEENAIVAASEESQAAQEDSSAPFPVAALPAGVSISYHITSALADGRAVYEWEREGDHYRITGEAEAEGLFTLFVEGRLLQESAGVVTAAGLRPDRFMEERPNRPREGLEFDWAARQVTFDRGGDRRTTALDANTVDWLSMIFQLAHRPPSREALEMQVFTQRKMYRFRLQVLGIEEIEIPLGTVRALHLRHDNPDDDREAIDVWLGLEQHHLPVKLRFPVARNRLMVEQVATRVSVRDLAP